MGGGPCKDYSCCSEIIGQIHRAVSKYNSCSLTPVEQLLKTPAIRKHVAEKLPRINELLNEFSLDKKAAD